MSNCPEWAHLVLFSEVSWTFLPTFFHACRKMGRWTNMNRAFHHMLNCTNKGCYWGRMIKVLHIVESLLQDCWDLQVFKPFFQILRGLQQSLLFSNPNLICKYRPDQYEPYSACLLYCGCASFTQVQNTNIGIRLVTSSTCILLFYQSQLCFIDCSFYNMGRGIRNVWVSSPRIIARCGRKILNSFFHPVTL